MRRDEPQPVAGVFLVVSRARGTKTKNGKSLSKDAVVRALDEPEGDANAWVPIVLHGRLDHVKRADVLRVRRPNIPKPTRAQLAARRRLLRRKARPKAKAYSRAS